MKISKIHKLALPLFLVWPFGSFLLSLSNIKSKSSEIVYIAFCFLFGLSFSFVNTSADSYRYAALFQMYEITDVWVVFRSFRDGALTDLYRFAIYAITRPLTNNPRILFAIFGLVFGYFSYNSLKLMNSQIDVNRNSFVFLILLYFFSLYPIPSMNGVRFNTAAVIFFYSTINYLFFRRNIWTIGVLSTILVHFSFIFFVPFVFLFRYFGRMVYSKDRISNMLLIAFILSVGVYWIVGTNSLPVNFLSKFTFLSDSVENKVALYTSDKVTEAVLSRNSLFHTITKVFGYVMNVYFTILIFKLKKTTKSLSEIKYSKALAFCFLLLTVGNFASVIPSGARFVSVSYLFILFLTLCMTQIYSRNYKKISLWGIPVFSFQIAYGVILLALLLVSPTLWYGNFFWILYEGFTFAKTLIL